MTTTRPKQRKPVPGDKRRPTSKSGIFERLASIGCSVPDSDWAKLPRDAAKNFDHYAHGSPREE